MPDDLENKEELKAEDLYCKPDCMYDQAKKHNDLVKAFFEQLEIAGSYHSKQVEALKKWQEGAWIDEFCQELEKL